MKLKRKTFVLWKKRLTIFFSLVFFVGALYVYFFTNTFTITNFSLQGIEEKDKERITNVLREAIAKNTLYIIPGNKIITFNIVNVKEAIRNALPNTDSIRVFPKGVHSLAISVTPHVPTFRTGEGEAYDMGGVRYQEQNDISHLPVISFTSSTTPPYIFFENLANFISQLTSLLFPVGHIIVDEYNDVYLYASGSPSRIILTRDADFKKSWLALVSAIDTDPLKTSLETKKGSLEYIDLRFGNKVFYKFTNDVKPAIIAPHATTTATTTVQ
ncbi:MAG: hypothetical protein QG653_381 [Patescibacteria group bacterium]|nr:hypothetical protein [Patescibacteria group bacterium]